MTIIAVIGLYNLYCYPILEPNDHNDTHRHNSTELITLYLCKPILSLVNLFKPAISQIRLKWSVFVYLYMWHCEHHTPAHLRVQHSKYWRCQAPLTDSVFRYCTGQTQASTGDQMSTTSHHPTSVKLMSLCRPEVLSFCVSKDWSTHQSSVCRCCLGYRPSWQCMLT